MIILEHWRSVDGYEGMYEVSNYGRVKSLDRLVTRSDGVTNNIKGSIKKLSEDKDGYLIVTLCKDGLSRKEKVHKLVCCAFVDGYFSGAEVNHIDFNRKNNNANNLEWTTHKDNVKHSSDANRYAESRNYFGKNNPNYGNRKLSEIYRNNKELALEKQSRPGSKNGRAKRVEMTISGHSIEFGCIRECAKYIIENGILKPKTVERVSLIISNSIKNDKMIDDIKFRFV